MAKREMSEEIWILVTKKIASYTSQHMDIYLLFYMTTFGYLLVRFFYLLVGLLFRC